MCLDGSPPGYYMGAGSGDGANKWILFLVGGGWCSSTISCYEESFGRLGSTANETLWPPVGQLFGIMANDSAVNPDFYNWNRVLIVYCDGGIFAGDRWFVHFEQQQQKVI